MTQTTFEPYTTGGADASDGLNNEQVNYTIETGKARVLRLLLITLFFVALMSLIIFGLIPYVEMLNQPTAPPLPSAIHT
ncbi:MAG: hypothetical protein AAFV93_05080 [Chloroflexota bacterium]